MSTLRQAEAARINGAKSLGPITPEGKLRVAHNAVKHGLLGKALLLRGESAELLEHLRQSFVAIHQPANDAEYLIVEEIVAAKWRLRRVWSIETRLLQFETDTMQAELEADFDNIDIATRIALGYRKDCDNSRALANLDRQEARLAREARRAEKHLAEIQAARIQKEQTALEAAPQSTAATENDRTKPPQTPLVHELPNKPGEPRLRLVEPAPTTSNEPPRGGSNG